MYRYSYLAWEENGNCRQLWNCNYYDPHHHKSFLKYNSIWVKIVCIEKLACKKEIFVEQIIR